MGMEVPRTLRAWFVVHALVSMAAGLALLAAPELALGRLGWTAIVPLWARLVGGAALAMGGEPLLDPDAGVDVYRARLRLNLLWSAAAAAAMFVGVGSGAPPAAWAFLSIFIVFLGVWLHHAIRFRQLERVPPAESPTPPDEPDDDEA
jgi:hypothetical protein